MIKIDEETKGCVLSKNAGRHRSKIAEAYVLAQQMREWKARHKEPKM